MVFEVPLQLLRNEGLPSIFWYLGPVLSDHHLLSQVSLPAEIKSVVSLSGAILVWGYFASEASFGQHSIPIVSTPL
jgi:hypothetical protein